MVPDNFVFSPEFQIIMTIIYSLSILVSVLGNSTVIYIVYKHKDMRTTTNLLLVNMACGDILVAILYMASQLKFLYLFDKWFEGVLGLILCKIVMVSQFIPVCATIWSTVVISVERLLAVISPLKKSFITSHCKIIIASIWLFSLLLLGHLFFYPQVLFIKKAWLCVYRLPFSYFVYFEHASHTFTFPLPLIIIILSYSVIVYRLHNRTIPGLNTNQQVQRVAATTRKVSRLTIVIISSFWLCWLPYYIFIEVARYPFEMQSVLVSVTWLSNLYSALNPVICISLNTNFRQRLQLLLKHVRVAHRYCFQENHPSFLSDKKVKTMDTRL